VVTLNIHDLQGRRVALLLDHVRRPAGVNEAGLNAEGWLAGLYLCRLEAGSVRMVQKMLVMR